MPILAESSIRAAISNIEHFGDTDIFPFPLEKIWLADPAGGVFDLLQEIDTNFDSFITANPLFFITSLAGVGYNGFRAATQIDPIWNAYLLALTIEIAPDIERARLPTGDRVVFSYRYSPDSTTGGLFDNGLGWRPFQTRALEHAASHRFALSTDIADFYPRVYHHRLENALNSATKKSDVVNRIMRLLGVLSRGVSYGLPIGGNAARLLAELVLDRVDRLLTAESVTFCRFVDDYVVFSDTRENALRSLVVLSDALLRNEGLTLARAKTRLMTNTELTKASQFAPPDTGASSEEAEARRFLRIRWKYDPYSSTAEEDYEELMDEVARFDVLAMLAREFEKTRVDEALVKQLIRSIKYLQAPVRDRAVTSIANNLNTLYPVFPTVAIALKALLPDISEPVRTHLFGELRRLLREGSHIFLVPTNRVYVVRLLAFDDDREAERLLSDLYFDKRADPMVRRDVIYAMAHRDARYWLSDILKRPHEGPWELRARLAASYRLGDEGKHWRRQIERRLPRIESQFLRWLGGMNNGVEWEIPL